MQKVSLTVPVKLSGNKKYFDPIVKYQFIWPNGAIRFFYISKPETRITVFGHVSGQIRKKLKFIENRKSLTYAFLESGNLPK